MSAFRIVPFVTAHLPEAADLWVEAWARAFPKIDFEARRDWFAGRIGELRDRGAQVLCAFHASDGRMAGLITLEAGHIDQLAVAPGAWGSGAAAALLGEAKRRCEHLLLDVNRDNARAARFYEREGFRRTGEGVNTHSGLGTWRYEWRRAAEIARSPAGR